MNSRPNSVGTDSWDMRHATSGTWEMAHGRDRRPAVERWKREMVMEAGQEAAEVDGSAFVADSVLPAFADAACHALWRRLQEKEAELQAMAAEVDDEWYRNKSMEQHKKLVEQEIRAMQEAVNATTRDWESTRQLKHLSEMEIRRLHREHVGCKKEIEQVQARKKEMQSRLHAGRKTMEEFQHEKKWNASEMSQWMEGAKALAEDKEAAMKMTKQQEQEMRKVELRIQHASEELMRKEDELQREVSHAHCAQAALNRSAAELRTLQNDCRNLNQRWKDAEDAFYKQEKQIKELQNERDETLRRTHGHKQEVDALQVQLRTLTQANHAASKTHQSLQSELETSRGLVEQQQEKVRSSQQALEEVHQERATIEKEKMELMAKLQEDQELVSKLNKNINDMARRLQKKEKETWKRLRHMEERDFQNAELEQELAKENECLHRSQQELEAKKQQLQKEQQILERLVLERKGLEQAIQSHRSQSKMLDGKIKDVSIKLHQQEHQLVRVEEKLNQVEWKMQRVHGRRTDSEREFLEEQIDGLSNDLKLAAQRMDAMKRDIHRLEQDMKGSQTRKEVLAQEMVQRQTHYTEEKMRIDSIQAELDRYKVELDSTRQQLQSQEGHMAKARQELKEEEATLLQKQKHHQDLQHSSEVYRTESEKEKNHKLKQIKETEEEIRKVSLEVQNKELKLGKLESKLEVLCQRLPLDNHTSQDAGAGVRNPGAVLQERKLLEGQKQELTSQLHNCQDEIAKLEVALADMVASNSHYRRVQCSGMTPAQKTALEEKKRLENTLQRQLKELNQRKQSESKELILHQEELDSVLLQDHTISCNLERALAEKEKIAKEVSACREKFKRACEQLTKLLRKAIATRAHSVYIKSLGELQQSVLQELKEAAQQHPQIALKLTQHAELCYCAA